MYISYINIDYSVPAKIGWTVIHDQSKNIVYGNTYKNIIIRYIKQLCRVPIMIIAHLLDIFNVLICISRDNIYLGKGD